MSFFQATPWHEGEEKMHQALHVPEQDNPTVPMLTQQAATMLQRAPLLAIGTLDAENRPWTTIWGGDRGFSQAIGQSIVGIRTPVAPHLDPVVERLVGKETDGEVAIEEGKGKMVGGLAIDLETRKRVKVYGRMVAGALGARTKTEDEATSETIEPQGEIQLVVKVEQSLGNCPKYLNKKQIEPAPTAPRLVSDSTILSNEAVSLITESDLFFISTSQTMHDMDTNHRGGPPGFVRILSNDSSSTTIVYPEYSGNRLYQTLGNLTVNPLAGLCFPNFTNGNCLYLTGTTEILIGAAASALLPRSNLAVKITPTAVRYIASVLPFRGKPGEPSPYNPSVRYLATEKSPTTPCVRASNTAKLLSQTPLTPTISRFRFALENAATYTAGQYVTLDFSSHLDIGYSHMRDDDPRSLNDDFVRTFTVSSPPGLPARPAQRLADDCFEITIRKVGVVTDFLWKYGLKERQRPGEGLEIGIKGFGGEFEISLADDVKGNVAFVAAGVGITPLMPSLGSLDLERLVLLWSLRREDLGLVGEMLKECSVLGRRISLFLTGQSIDQNAENEAMDKLRAEGVGIHERRIEHEDLKAVDDRIKRWYVCTGNSQKKVLLQWLQGKEVVFEDYNF